MQEIILDYDLGCCVRAALDLKFKNKPAPPRIPNAYNYNQSFSQEELDSITGLTLKNICKLDGLKNLKNLKTLTLTTLSNLELDEKNLNSIKNLKNLESLSINGYRGFKSIDCFDFCEKLYFLELTNCPDLEAVQNLNNSITSFKCVANYKLKNSYELVSEALRNVYDMNEYVLDVTYAPEFFRQMEKYEKHYAKGFFELATLNIKFGEEISKKLFEHSFNQIKLIQEKAAQISHEVITATDDDEMKFANLYVWICKNIKYDDAGLENPTRRHTSGELGLGRELGTNNFINGFVYKSCVCEGFAKSLQYLCKYNKLNTSLVSCHTGDGAENILDHSIMQFENKGVAYYCDPTWDAGRFQKGIKDFKYFLLSEQEMSVDHKTLTSNKPMTATTAVENSYKKNLLSKVSSKN